MNINYRFTFIAGLIAIMLVGLFGAKQAQASETGPNDPFLNRQTYLEQIGVKAAWAEQKQNESIVIAIVDTGVDLSHPDLQGNLVPGINLVQPALPPDDDNGHGTNVAGVIAAIGNNGIGTSGMLWKTKIMPIKALERSGRGDEDKLAAGIRYAVDHGAKIVVLSVGLLRNDPLVEDAVQYAESKDVLLIAAAGNDEGRHIRYPAAYPTVLAVGAVSDDNLVEERANFGPELDLVSSWSVFTTGYGGKYQYQYGTSMAAPQAAAAAALIWGKHPDMRVHEVRNLLRQTAEDLEVPGWDEFTGYGLLRVDRALTEPYIPDIYEPNNQAHEAKPYSIGKMISAELDTGSDADQFTIDVPYDGHLSVELHSEQASPSPVQLTFFQEGEEVGQVYPISTAEPVELQLKRGNHRISLQYADPKEGNKWRYRLSSRFAIQADAFEENNSIDNAYELTPRSQTLTGTFHSQEDEDWFSMSFEQSGIVEVKVTTDSKRIDSVLLVQKQGERLTRLDENGDGEMESATIEVFPGLYYFGVKPAFPGPAVAEYELTIDYKPVLIDPNEPNDRSFQATSISLDTEYSGVIDNSSDLDWFKFTIPERSLVGLNITELADPSQVWASVYNNGLTLIDRAVNVKGTNHYTMLLPLESGSYYVRLGGGASVEKHQYHLKVTADLLDGDYVDISNHWAKASITRLTHMGIIDGYGDYHFRPEQTVTRAEAVTMIVRAFGYDTEAKIEFPDVSSDHWVYTYLAKAAGAGITEGYPDGSFRPDNRLSRAELAALLAKVRKLTGEGGGEAPFIDVPESHWASSALRQMKGLGWINGYADGTYRPHQETTRAEFASLLYRIMQQ